MSDLGARLGSTLLRNLAALNLATAFVLAGALIANRLLARRISASVRVSLFLLVFARLALPAGWSSPVGLLGARSTAGGVAVEGPTVTAALSTAAPHVGPELWVGLAYLTVAAVLLAAWLGARLLLARRLRRTRSLEVDGARIEEHESLGPLVAGMFRPRIVVPAPLARDPETLRHVLRHEAAHIARRDQFLMAGIQLTCILAWPILPLWLAARQIRVLVEMACDDRALAGRPSDDRRSYGEALLALAEGRLPVTRHALLPSFGSDLHARLRALRPRRLWSVPTQLALASALAAALVACSAAPEAEPHRVVTLGSDGQVLLDGHRIELARLQDELTGYKGTVHIKADLRRRDQDLERLMQATKLAGVRVSRVEAFSGAAPDTIPGQAKVQGSMDKEIIRRVIRRHIDEVKACYERVLSSQPELGGRVVVRFTIGSEGRVTASEMQATTIKNESVEGCIVEAVRSWEFPKPLGGGVVIVSYPFVLTPAGRNATETGQPRVEGGLATNAVSDVVARHINEVKWCYDQGLASNPALAGRVEVQFTIAATGQVVASVLQSSTLGNSAVENCVVKAARRWQFPKPTGGGIAIVKYPFVFQPQ